MIGLIQRVSHARVVVGEKCIAETNRGILSLIAIQKDDTPLKSEKLLDRLLNYRIFPDKEGKMNQSLREINGGLILVPQFTLAADTKKGTRPSFSNAAPPDQGQSLFDHLCSYARRSYAQIGTGQFGADMKVSLTNDGPVTFWLEV